MANYTPNTWTDGDVVTKTKLDRLEAGAAAALPSADAATVAKTGSYTDLINQPATAAPRTDFGPGDHGLLAWSYDPSFLTAGSALTSGTLYLTKMRVPTAVTVTNIVTSVATAGTGLTTGQCFAALYDANRNLLGVTADQSTAFASIGLKTMALTTPVSVTAGYCYAAFWAVGTTPPQISRMSGGLAVLAAGLTTSSYRYGSSTTGLTTTAPATAAVMTLSSAWWAAIS